MSDGNIIIVDDLKTNLDVLSDILSRDGYKVRCFSSSAQVLRSALTTPPDLFLLDIVMPGMDGLELCRSLLAEATLRHCRVIFISSLEGIDDKVKAFRAGGVDFIQKPFHETEVLLRVNTQIQLKKAKEDLEKQNEILERKVQERTRDIQIIQDVMISSLSALAETRDNQTGGHIYRTESYVQILAEKLLTEGHYPDVLRKEDLLTITTSAPLHDIGKVGVPDSILLKPGKLTPEEFEIMKTHTTLGRDALLKAEQRLGSNSFLRYAREIAYSHHEHWDGNGYPQGLSGTEIPVAGRIMAVADIYDALISKRVYKEPIPHSRAVEIILSYRGTHLDPVIVDIFTQVSEDFRQAALATVDFPEERETLLL